MGLKLSSKIIQAFLKMVSKNNQNYPELTELSDRNKSSFVKIAFYVVIPAILLFYALGSYRTFSSHEAFAVVPAQGMINSGDWVVPRFSSIPRLKKPPLAYWVIASTAEITGLGINEWTARFPAAISAILLAALIGYWAKKWYGTEAGMVAAFIQIASVYTITYGRKAEIDMMLCLFTTSALFLIADSDDSESRKKRWIRWIAIYVLISISWMAKFHYSLGIIVCPSVLFFLIQKRYRTFINWFNPVGLMIFFTAVVVWPYMVLQQLPSASDIWFNETVGRALGSKGTDPYWFYIPFLIWMPLPWTPLVLWGGWQSFVQAWKNGNPRERFLWIWIFSIVFIVTIQPVKHSHYLLGCLPAFSLLAARPAAKLWKLLNREQPFFAFWGSITVFNTFAISGLIAAFVISMKWPMLKETAWILCGVFVVGGALTAYLTRTVRPVRAFYMAAVTVMTVFILSYGWIMPKRDHRVQSAIYAQSVKDILPHGELLNSFDIGMDPIIFYLDLPVNRLLNISVVEKELNKKKRLILLTRRKKIKMLETFGSLKVIHHFKLDKEIIKPKRADWVIVDLRKFMPTVQISQYENDSPR